MPQLVEVVVKVMVVVLAKVTDRYGRLLGLVFVNGTNVNLEMVKAGFAEVYRGKHAKNFDPKIYQDAEEEAVKENRGMWIQGDKYISPRDWRKGRRN